MCFPKVCSFVKGLLVGVAVAAVCCHSVSAATFKEMPEFGPFFEAHGLVGTFVLFDREADTIFVWNEARAQQRFRRHRRSRSRTRSSASISAR